MVKKHLEREFEPLMKKLGYHMNNINLLVEAMTRQSAIQESKPEAAVRDFQRLEFLGDRVLNLAIADFIVKGNQETVSEGTLHQQMQQLITNRGSLVEIARKLNVEKYLIKGQGEVTVTDDMYADALEAILGAIYIDCFGLMSTMRKVIKSLWALYLDKLRLPHGDFMISTNEEKKATKALSGTNLSRTRITTTTITTTTRNEKEKGKGKKKKEKRK